MFSFANDTRSCHNISGVRCTMWLELKWNGLHMMWAWHDTIWLATLTSFSLASQPWSTWHTRRFSFERYVKRSALNGKKMNSPKPSLYESNTTVRGLQVHWCRFQALEGPFLDCFYTLFPPKWQNLHGISLLHKLLDLTGPWMKVHIQRKQHTREFESCRQALFCFERSLAMGHITKHLLGPWFCILSFQK